MHEADIRNKLLNNLQDQYSNDPGTRILQEFGVCQGTVRIDVAVVNGSLSGYEIKSDMDTLERLPLQQKIYSQVFDKVVIIVGRPHTEKVQALIPSWWGVWQAEEEKRGPQFITIRDAKENPEPNPFSLAQCLWREEALTLLREKEIDRGLTKASRSILWHKLAVSIPVDELKECVRLVLKSRDNWQPVWQPKSDDDLSRLRSIPLVKLDKWG